MGQFDNVIPVKVTSGKTVTTASVRAPKKPVVVDKEGNEVKKAADVNGGGGATSIGVNAGEKFRTLEGRLRTPRKVGLAKPSEPEPRNTKSGKEKWEPKAEAASSAKPKTEGKTYDLPKDMTKIKGNTKIRLGGQQFLDDKGAMKAENVASREQQIIPTTANDKTGAGTTRVVKHQISEVPLGTGIKHYETASSTESDISDAEWEKRARMAEKNGPGPSSNPDVEVPLAGPVQQIKTPVRERVSDAPKYNKPDFKDPKAGKQFPISSLNTDWANTKVTRGPQRGTKELDLSKAPEVKVPGQTEAQMRADASRAGTRKSTPSRTVGYDPESVHKHALQMAVRDGASLGEMSSDSFTKGYHHTKATVMALAGMGTSEESEATLNKHLGSGAEHKNNLNTIYNHLTNRARFNETSKPGKGTQYSAARGNVDVAPTSKDYYVPKGTNSLVHASKLGNKTLEGSTVPFEGYKPNTGADKDETPYHEVNVHQGYHPTEETHPVTGERVRVFRHTDVPAGAIHVGDVAAEAAKSGKSMYAYEKQQRMQRDASKGPSAKSREGHGRYARDVIDQQTASRVTAGVTKGRGTIPETGSGRVERRQIGSATTEITPLNESEKTLASKVEATRTEGKFIEVPPAKSDVFKAKEAD